MSLTGLDAAISLVLGPPGRLDCVAPSLHKTPGPLPWLALGSPEFHHTVPSPFLLTKPLVRHLLAPATPALHLPAPAPPPGSTVVQRPRRLLDPQWFRGQLLSSSAALCFCSNWDCQPGITNYINSWTSAASSTLLPASYQQHSKAASAFSA